MRLFIVPIMALLSAAHAQLPTADFADGVKHYRDGVADAPYARHEETEVAAIAENILLHQRENGGWPGNWDPLRKLDAEEAKRIARNRRRDDTMFDNRATYPQVEYLAGAYGLTQDARYKEAALKGLAFIFGAQHACGGFPHSYPNDKDYRPYITFMDDVTTGVLTTLRKAGKGAAPFEWLDAPERDRARAAAERGLHCVLQLQLRAGDALAVWCGQYHHETLEAVAARPFEPAGLVSAESVSIVQFLMKTEDPSAEVVAAIDGAMAWFEQVKITGMRLERFDIEPVRFTHHTARQDVRLVPDADAPPLWSRFYEFDTLRPYMANRDGNKVYRLEDVELERRTGYGWYTGAPAVLLDTAYPAWKGARGR